MTDKANQITDINKTAGADWVDPSYGSSGNMDFGPKPGDETNGLLFFYDAWNRLTGVVADNGDETFGMGDTILSTYAYDGLFRRVSKVDYVASDTYDYYYNEGWQLLETRLDGDPYQQFVWDARYIDAPVCRFRDTDSDGDTDDETLYYANDANMNVTAVLDDSGNVVERYAYDPYGKVAILNGASGTDQDVTGGVAEWDADTDGVSDVDNPILYAGYHFDAETGMYHVRRRAYLPSLGRWVQRDPLGYVDGMSLYEYAKSWPTKVVDSHGASVDDDYKACRDNADQRQSDCTLRAKFVCGIVGGEYKSYKLGLVCYLAYTIACDLDKMNGYDYCEKRWKYEKCPGQNPKPGWWDELLNGGMWPDPPPPPPPPFDPNDVPDLDDPDWFGPGGPPGNWWP